MTYTLRFTLRSALAQAVAVEWTDATAPEGSGSGWEPCLRQADGTWLFSSTAPVAAPRHLRDPGLFANIGLRYRLEATGPWSEASASRKDFVILDVSEDPDPDSGEGSGGGDGTGSEPPAPPVAPVLLTAPTLSGAGLIGTALSADAGLWTSATTPDFAYLWLRDGTPIAGATGAVYVPGPEDDLSDLAVRVTATNAGGATEAVSAARRVTYAAPVARGDLFDEVFDQGSGEQIVETAQAFEGENLRFALADAAGIDARIESETGILRIATDAPLSGTEVAVIASNSGGSARSAFLVTIEASEPITETPKPAALAAADWQFGDFVVSPRDGEFPDDRFAATVIVPEQYTQLRWVGVSLATPDRLGAPATLLAPGIWRLDDNGGNAFAAIPIGGHLPQLRLRVGFDLANMSEWSLDAKQGLVVPDPGPVDPPTGNDPLPPADAPLATTEMRTSVTYPGGCVFTFNKAMPCGRYWNGDWFVHNAVGAGGFRITSVTPNSVKRATGVAAGKWTHGLMRDCLFARPSFTGRGKIGLEEYFSDNPSTSSFRYDDALNVNPNKSGDLVFSDGQEGSLMKGVGAPDESIVPETRSRMDYVHILTIVKDIPKVNSFRPSPDGEVPKAAIASLADVDLTPFETRANLTGGVARTLSQTKLALTGPFFSPCRLSAARNTLYGRKQTYDIRNPAYSAVWGLTVWSAFYYIFDSKTSEADRKELIHKICQIGLDFIQSGTATRYEYWPSHNAVAWHALIELTAIVCDNAPVREAYTIAKANRSYTNHLVFESNYASDPLVNGAKEPWRVLDETDMFFRGGPEGRGPRVLWKQHYPIQTAMIPDQEYGQKPYTGGHIGYPGYWGSGNENEGYHTSWSYNYARQDQVSSSPVGLVACLRGTKRDGIDNLEWFYVGAVDRIYRVHEGYRAGKWDINAAPDWTTAHSYTDWTQGMVNLYAHIRNNVGNHIPWWLGRPEQPFPPMVSKPGSGQLRMAFGPFRCSNNGPITGAQYRIRRIRSTNVSGSWLNNTTLYPLVYYNTAPWNTLVNISPTTANVTVSGLASGIWQVQWRLQNASGWSPWSTNAPYRTDQQAANGWPEGPRAVIFI